ncbi:MAG: DUF4386 domain-containing protein [Candidatus Thorarchaeota archaeon]|jgi:hypothetical protein
MFDIVSGFFFLLIIVLLMVATSKYGYDIHSELDSHAKLTEISDDPQKFRTGVLIVIVEHLVIVSLAISLFIAFSPFNLILGITWVFARGIEGLIQIPSKRKYLGLLTIAEQYSNNETEKDSLADKALIILKSKNSTFSLAQILFSVGTFAYSLLFVLTAAVPVLLGWFGIVASVVYGLGNGVYQIKPSNKALWDLGGLLIWIYELILGGWLLITPFIFP